MHSFFDPASPQSRAVSTLWWWMFAVGMVIWLGVTAVAILASRSRRGGVNPDDPTHTEPATERRLERIVGAAVGGTVLILFAFLVYDFSVGRALAAHPDRALTI